MVKKKNLHWKSDVDTYKVCLKSTYYIAVDKNK